MNHEKFDIVIVEDNENDAGLIIRTLRKNNITKNFIVLEDGEKALDFFLCRGPYSKRNITVLPKVIFLDIKLPKVDGLDVLMQLRLNEHTKKIPTVIVSSSKQDSDIETAYELGANSYIVKPVDFNQFKSIIDQLGLYWLKTNESL